MDRQAVEDRVWWALRDRVWGRLEEAGLDPTTVRRLTAEACADAVIDLAADWAPRPVDSRPWVAWAVEQLGPRDLPPGVLANRLREVADRLDARCSALAEGNRREDAA